MTTALSILDLVPRGTGVSSAQALHHALALARLGERLGYTRLWYAEHHNMAGVLSTTPELITTTVHDHADRLRSYELLASAFGLAT